MDNDYRKSERNGFSAARFLSPFLYEENGERRLRCSSAVYGMRAPFAVCERH